MPFLYFYFATEPFRLQSSCWYLFVLNNAVNALFFLTYLASTSPFIFIGITLVNFMCQQALYLLMYMISKHHRSAINNHKIWDHLTWMLMLLELFSCIVTYGNYSFIIAQWDSLHFCLCLIVAIFLMLQTLMHCMFSIYISCIIFMYYVICAVFNKLRPPPSYFAKSSLKTSISDPYHMDCLPNDWSNVGMGRLPGRKQTRYDRDLCLDLKRIICECDVRCIATLMPKHQLQQCQCSHIFELQQEVMGNRNSEAVTSVHFAIEDFVIPDDINNFDKNCIDILLQQKIGLEDVRKKMLIHCLGGQGRTGTAVACMLMKYDPNKYDLRKAIEMMRSVRGKKMLTNALQQAFCSVYYHYCCVLKQHEY